jgi:hypothetical protein
MLYFCKRGWVSCSFFFVVTCVCVSQAVENLPPKITRLAPSGYQTVIINENGTPGAVVLLPQAELPNGPAHQWAQDIGLPTIDEVGLNNPLPTYPLQGINPDTNLILLSVGRGGPMVQALRRAMLVIEDQRIPGAGGYAIRVIARPFAASQANVIVISAGDRKSLAKACDVFKQGLKKNGGTIYEKFLVVEPGPQWKKVRSRWYDAQVGDPFFDDLTAFAEGYNKSNGRSFCQLSAQLADRYYGTGNIEFAKLYKKHIYGFRYDIGRDDHMGLHLLVQGWDRIEECSVFTEEDRLKIINFIFQSCSGSEGYENYTVSPDFACWPDKITRQSRPMVFCRGICTSNACMIYRKLINGNVGLTIQPLKPRCGAESRIRPITRCALLLK